MPAISLRGIPIPFLLKHPPLPTFSARAAHVKQRLHSCIYIAHISSAQEWEVVEKEAIRDSFSTVKPRSKDSVNVQL